MTKLSASRRCRWCGRPLAPRSGPGRPREFCRASCRQQDYVARQRATEVGLSEAELVVARSQLDELHDRLYVLEAAIEDVERDVAEGEPDAAALREALDWLLEAARPVVGQRLQPTGAPAGRRRRPRPLT